MNKEIIRKEALKKRAELTSAEISNGSILISDFFFNEFLPKHRSIKTIHLFLPIEKKKEVNTNLIFEKLKKEYPTIAIALSRCDFSSNNLTLFKYSEHTVLEQNQYGIPEPTGGLKIQPKDLDLILLPLLAVDRKGNRIGYGKGFYDRLLAECSPNCLFLGLSFDNPIPEISPEKFDIPIHYCLTTNGLYSFKAS